MLPKPEFFRSIEALGPLERAAALAHRVYVETARRVGWPLRVAENWQELADKEKDFNTEATRTLAMDDHLYNAWLAAMAELRKRCT